MTILVQKITHKVNSASAANLWLLGGLVMVTLPHIAYQPPAIMLCGSLLLLWRLLYDLKYTALPPRWLRIGLAFAAFAGVGALHQTIFGRNAGVALLLIMLYLKLLEMRTQRDFIIAVSLGYFVVITAFLYSQSMVLAVYLFASMVVLTTALILSNRRDSPKLFEKTNLRLAGTMLLQAMPLAVLLFVLFPRLPTPIWGLPEDAFEAKSGLSDHMSPGQISHLSDNDQVAFRVQFNSALPSPSQLYWRGPVLDHFDGKTWDHGQTIIMSNSVERAYLKPRSGKGNLPAGEEATVRYAVTLEPHNQRWLFALEMPTQAPPHSAFSGEFELLADGPVKKLSYYQLQSDLDYRLQPQRLANRHLYLQLPSNIGIQAQQLILQLISSIATQNHRDEKVVAAILNYFRQQPFIYTKQPPLLKEDPVDEFLFGTRQGFCEHYASAFTFLMRAAGIPARVVTGYQGGEFNTLGDYLIVRQSDAHAWSEVWIAGKGWTRVDPTAVIPPARIRDSEQLQRFHSGTANTTVNLSWLGSAWRKMKFGWDNVNHYWNMWIIGYNNKRQVSFLNWLGMGSVGWQGVTVILFAGLFTVVLLVAARLLYRHEQPGDPAQKLYRRFCRKLARIGLRKSPSEGAAHFAQRAIADLPEFSQSINRITHLYNALRYGQDCDVPKHDATLQLRAAVNSFQPRRAGQSGINICNKSFK